MPCNTIAQIDVTENFESYTSGEDPWGGDFYINDESSCEGDLSLAVNMYYFFGFGLLEAEVVSNSIGTSNGGEVTLSYDYKILSYGDLLPVDNIDNWGSFQILYGTSETGPFTLLETVNTENHIVSENCATRDVSFAVPAGEEVYLKIHTFLDNTDLDYYVFIDNIVATQGDVVACSGTPEASDTVSSSDAVCNTENFTLSLSEVYAGEGLTFQWQTSSDGVVFTDVEEGGDSFNYTTTQNETTWYQAVITCTNSEESVTSTPTMVLGTGLPCYCDIVFDSDVEPITYVNFAGIDNETSSLVNGTPGVENFTALPPAEVIRGQSYTITLQGNTAGDYDGFFMLYIDFNQNGVLDDEGEAFEAGSVYFSSGEDGEQAITEIQIPADALEGVTYMRVLKLFDEYSTDPCSSEDGVGYGQAEDYLINITACTTEAPTAAAEQNFCLEASIQELVADGEDGDIIQWYTAETGGEPIEGSAMLTDDTVYYASITPEGGCESEVRTAVTVYIHTVETPTVQLVQPTCTEPTGIIEVTAPLGVEYEYSIDGENFQASPIFEGVVSNTYQIYASVDGCASEPIQETILDAPEVPEVATVAVTQPTCINTVGTIEVTAPVGADYEYSIDGVNYQVATTFADLMPGTYEVTVKNFYDCTSVTSAIVINTVPVVDAPTAESEQTLCAGATIDDLEAEGDDLVWYDAENGGNILAEETELVDGTTYYVAATDGDCESDRVAVMVTINVVAAPTGESTQEFDEVISISDIVITATGEVMWYATEEDAMNGENDLDPSTEINENGTYYATQTIDGCESEPFAVTVSIVLSADGFNKANFMYHPNPVKDVLTLSYQNTIDAVQVYSLLGQKVVEQSGNQNEMKLDMSQLAAGNYIIKVISGATTTTAKVIKE